MGPRVWTLPAVVLAGIFLSVLPAYSQEVYQREIGVMKSTVEALNYSAELIENASNATEMTRALEQTADRLILVMPEMLKVGKEHPDWGDSTPAEVAPEMKLFDKASRRFFDAIGKATNYVNEFTDDKELKSSFGRVNKAMR